MNMDPEREALPEAAPDEPLPVQGTGLLAKHWRGDCSLARSYWGNGVLIFHVGINTLAIAVLTAVVVGFKGKTALVLIVGLGEVALIIAAYVWALVGIWRAARKYQGLRLWPILARAAIIFGILQSIVNLLQTLDAIGKAAFE
jgi:hypothetical protein